MSSLISAITPFTGKENNFDLFIRQINDIGTLENWEESKKILVLKINLKENALKFLVENKNIDKITNYEELVNKLRNKFVKKDNFEEIQRNFRECKQTTSQSIQDLADEVSSKTQNFINPFNSEDPDIKNLTQKLKLSKFIEALRPDVRIEVKKQGPKSFKAAVAAAKNIESALADNDTNSNAMGSSEFNHILAQQINTNQEILKLSEKIENISKSASVNNLSQVPSTSNVENNAQNLQCQLCGKFNHTAKTCYLYTRGNFRHNNNHNRGGFNRNNNASFHPYSQRNNFRGRARGNFRGRVNNRNNNLN